MATSPFPFPYHAAATYHHPSPIGFPTAYTPASTVFPPPPPAPTPIDGHQIGCYTLPFSSYPAPASGAFPTPAYDAPPCSPPSTPCSTPFPFGSSPHHAYGHGFIPTQASQTAYCPNQPPPLPVPATSEFSGDLSSWSPLCSRPMLQQQKDSPTTSWPEPSPALDLEKSKPSAEAQVRAEANISKDMPRAVLDLKRRLDELQARDRTSFDKLRGELAKLTSMATQLAVSIGKQTTSAIPGSSPLGVTGTAPVAPKVFDKMPTPSSGHRTQASTTTAPTPSVGFIPSSGSTTFAASAPWLFSAAVGSSASSPSEASTAAYVAPSVIDEMPQSYGFSNLNRQSVCLADGTAHNYSTLPANYPLERAAPEPVFALYNDKTEGDLNESADVFTTTLEQQPSEDAREESGQSRKYFSRPSENPLPEVISEFTLTVNVDVSVAKSIKFKHGQCIPQVLDYAYTPGCAIGDVLTDYKWNMLLSEEHREVWDPGALLPLMSSRAQHFSQALQAATDATILAGSSVTGFSVFKCLPFWVQTNIYVLWKSEVGMTTYISWDPGILNIIYMLLHKLPNSVQFIKLIAEHFILSLTACMQHIASNDISYVLHATCFVLQRSAHITQGNYICSWYCNSVLKMSSVWDPGVKISLHSWLDISTVWSATDKPLSCTHIPDLAAWQNQSIGSGACYIWDPSTILWYTFIWLALATVRETLYAYYLALRHSNGRCFLYSENIMCYLIVYSVLEEKKMPNGPSTRFWTSKLEPMQCTYYYETCNSQQYSHQDITFREIALWLIHFKPP